MQARSLLGPLLTLNVKLYHMKFPIIIRGRIKLENIPWKDKPSVEIINYISSSLNSEGASVEKTGQDVISFARPFVIFEFNWRPLGFISNGTIELIETGFSSFMAYRLNYVYLYILATTICAILFFLQLFRYDFPTNIIVPSIIWIILITGNIFFSIIRFESFIRQEILNFSKQA